MFSLVTAAALGHGAMITPAPRSAHGQVYDDANSCGCADKPGGCYSNATSPGYYCGLGCLGEACLYYQIGCFQGCGTCSYEGKTLYPVQADLDKAGCAVPPEPTLGGGDPHLEHQLRTMNIDNASALGDWTRWMPWRSPGSTGKGNPKFQPCGVNSGADGSLVPAKGQPIFANGTDLPPLPLKDWAKYTAGQVIDAEFSIYANHGGGYSYRLCKVEPGQPVTEACFQQTPLNFATDTSTIHYYDNSQPDFTIEAVTTKAGTYPAGSMWRKNPVPMCNCDDGVGCRGEAAAEAATFEAIMSGGKSCHAVPKSQCGQDMGVNTCLKCGSGSVYDCEECCPGTTKVSKDGYTYCYPSSKPGPSPPGPSPKPSPGCDPSTLPTDNARGCYQVPYPNSYLTPGQKVRECTTGVQYPTKWDGGAGAGLLGEFMFSITDKLQLPTDLKPGHYQLGWRWDCEETPQVWNSCADVLVV